MLKSSNNSAWVRLGTVEERTSFAIRYEDRFQRLLPNLDDRPSFTLFLGNKNKTVALRQIFPENNVQRCAEDYYTLNLHLDNVTKLTDAPVVFADGDPRPHEVGEHVPLNQGPSFAIPLPLATEYGNAVWAAFLSLGVLPHADVVCIFTEDCGGLDRTQDLLEMWADVAPTSQYHPFVRPHLILVNSDATINRRNMPPALLQPFSDCSVVMLASSGRSSVTRHASLKANFEQAVASARSRRASASMLFSAKHLNALLLQSMKQFNQPTAVPFNVLEASRRNNPVSLDYGVHLTNFMVLAKNNHIPHEAVRSFVASAILMDAYPPDMHIFDPKALYSVLYRSCCLFSCHKVFADSDFAEYFCQEIENHLTGMVQHMGTEDLGSTAQLRRAENFCWKRYWASLKSSATCLSCLLAKPEHALSCGHLLCDQCIEIFGDGVIGGEHQYLVQSCLLCSEPNDKVVRLKPKTAGPRLLSIDGGGTRGVVPLEALKILQDHLGLPCAIQDFFDFAIGTSAGGLSVLGLFLKGLTVEKSLEMFRLLVREFFRGQPLQKPTSFAEHCKRIFKCAVYDGIYEVGDLEVALVSLFGVDTPMIESKSDTKVAVTATSDKSPSARLFTNYNGPDSPHQDSGYRIERPHNIQHEVRIWQAARATAAAPILFPPIDITGLGSFWDGAMSRHNNPVNLALWESRRLWPDIENPDVIVSLGTGIQEAVPTSPVKGAWSMLKRSVISNRCVPRLWSSMMGFLEGEDTSRDLRNRLNATARHDYFRFNIALAGATPAIDDVGCMDALAKQVRSRSPGSTSYVDTAIALLVSCLFFELDSVPTRQISGRYYCKGTIRCRFPDAQALINALRRLGCEQMLFYKDDKSLGCKLQEEDLCGTCQRYSRKIQFLALSLEEPLTLSLRWQDSSRNLSAMPHPLSWFMEMQQMDSPFGSRNHGTAGAIHCPSCETGPIDVGTVALCLTCDTHSRRKRSRDRSPATEEAPPRKSRRLRINTASRLQNTASSHRQRRDTVFTDLGGD